MIIADQESNILHEPVPVPDHRNPFSEDPTFEGYFFEALAEVRQEGIVPPGYGILPSEWAEEGYSPLEEIRLGRSKTLTVALPDDIWRPRAELWVQGLDVLTRLIEEMS